MGNGLPSNLTGAVAVKEISANAVSSVNILTIGTTEGQVVAANARRRGVVLQNTGTTVIYLTLDGSAPTSSSYHFALKACSSANDGTGGVYTDDITLTEIRAISSGAGGKLSVVELT